MINLATILTLSRPFVVFDCESTGPAVERDRIIQIAITKHYPDKEPIRWKSFINPQIPVPTEVARVHGITNEMLKDAPVFQSLAADLARTAMTNVDFGGHNILFDLRLFRAECRRAEVNWNWETSDARIIDTLRIRQITAPNDLSTVYEDITGKKLDGAHDAGVDVEATEEVLEGQVKKYQLPRTVEELSTYCWPKRHDAVDVGGKFVWRHGEATFAFGKNNGVQLRLCDRGYLKYMLNGDFPPDVKSIVADALKGIFPVRGDE